MVEASTKPIKVLIAGLTADLHMSLKDMTFELPDIQVLDRVPSLSDAMEFAESRKHDVLMIEVPLEDGNYPPVFKQKVRDNTWPRVIAVAPREDAELLLQAAFLGAAAFVSRDTPLESLVSTIRRVALGEEPIEYNMVGNRGIASEVIRFLRGSNITPGMTGTPSPLSQQQHNVLKSVAQGMTNGEIATALGLKEQTVKNYMTAILKRVGARDRAQAVVFALNYGWITLDPRFP